MRTAEGVQEIMHVAGRARVLQTLAPLRLELFGLLLDEAIKHEIAYSQVAQGYLDGKLEPRFRVVIETFITSSSIPREAVTQLVQHLIDMNEGMTLDELALAVAKYHSAGINYVQSTELLGVAKRFCREQHRIKRRNDQVLILAQAQQGSEE